MFVKPEDRNCFGEYFNDQLEGSKEYYCKKVESISIEEGLDLFWSRQKVASVLAIHSSEINETDKSKNIFEKIELIACYQMASITLRIDDVLAIDNKTDSKSYFYLKDHLGSIVDIADNQGAVKQHYVYSSFGEIQKVTDANGLDISEGPILEHHLAYTGREWDSESGLYHYRARSYDARVGRFLQVDPEAGKVVSPISFINRYSYVYSNPNRYSDPEGREAFILTATLGFSNPVGWAVIAVAAIYVIINWDKLVPPDQAEQIYGPSLSPDNTFRVDQKESNGDYDDARGDFADLVDPDSITDHGDGIYSGKGKTDSNDRYIVRPSSSSFGNLPTLELQKPNNSGDYRSKTKWRYNGISR